MLCDELISPECYFCDNCVGKVSIISDEICTCCGLALKKCRCKNFIYYFDGIISPFYNKTTAKECFYQFKFHKNRRNGNYFAQKMAEWVERHYKNIPFDSIAYVCKSKNGNSFNQTRYLAKRVSELLHIPIYNCITNTDKKRQIQHNTRMNSRFENVRDAYKLTKSVKNRKILLIDDIKTTGATISECARILKLNGASCVYCVTALVGDYNSKD